MQITRELTSAQIVLLGEFSPKQFSPDLLVSYGLIGAEQCAQAKVNLSHDVLEDVSIDWFRLIVTSERFIITSTEAPWIRLSDFCLKLFTEALSPTRLTKMGINRSVQFDVGSLKNKDNLGRLLSPRSSWGKWGEILESDEGLGASGVSSITMKQGHGLIDRSSGYIEARIAPAEKTSVLMNINDHYDAVEDDEPAELMKILHRNFEASLERSDWIVSGIMEQVGK